VTRLLVHWLLSALCLLFVARFVPGIYIKGLGDRERIIAGTDCGFGTFTGREWVIEPVVWLKLKSLSQGAQIASSRLWS